MNEMFKILSLNFLVWINYKISNFSLEFGFGSVFLKPGLTFEQFDSHLRITLILFCYIQYLLFNRNIM